ncbi:hypothetical protein FRB99_006528 [Tulasnella sp. 403]|nr:hypothetical protein FRB99_006528 [Tulasnella sp. 403]
MLLLVFTPSREDMHDIHNVVNRGIASLHGNRVLAQPALFVPNEMVNLERVSKLNQALSEAGVVVVVMYCGQHNEQGKLLWPTTSAPQYLSPPEILCQVLGGDHASRIWMLRPITLFMSGNNYARRLQAAPYLDELCGQSRFLLAYDGNFRLERHLYELARIVERTVVQKESPKNAIGRAYQGQEHLLSGCHPVVWEGVNSTTGTQLALDTTIRPWGRELPPCPHCGAPPNNRRVTTWHGAGKRDIHMDVPEGLAKYGLLVGIPFEPPKRTGA